jgi:hypothetical protein
MDCIVCGTAVVPDRWDIGKRTCHSCGSAQALELVQDEFRLILMPKQGFGIVKKDSPDLLNGKSSGRSS